jgi:hypothetical protein
MRSLLKTSRSLPEHRDTVLWLAAARANDSARAGRSIDSRSCPSVSHSSLVPTTRMTHRPAPPPEPLGRTVRGPARTIPASPVRASPVRVLEEDLAAAREVDAATISSVPKPKNDSPRGSRGSRQARPSTQSAASPNMRPNGGPLAGTSGAHGREAARVGVGSVEPAEMAVIADLAVKRAPWKSCRRSTRGDTGSPPASRGRARAAAGGDGSRSLARGRPRRRSRAGRGARRAASASSVA